MYVNFDSKKKKISQNCLQTSPIYVRLIAFNRFVNSMGPEIAYNSIITMNFLKRFMVPTMAQHFIINSDENALVISFLEDFSKILASMFTLISTTSYKYKRGKIVK